MIQSGKFDTYMDLQLARHAVAIGGNADGAGDGKGGGVTGKAHDGKGNNAHGVGIGNFAERPTCTATSSYM